MTAVPPHPSPSISGPPTDSPTEGLLGIVVDLAVRTLGDVDAASVSVAVGEHHMETVRASCDLLLRLDDAQYAERAGPCVEAVRSGDEVAVDLPVEAWPRFSTAALRAGFARVWALPLTAGDTVQGSLNLYSRSGRPWAGDDMAVGRTVAAAGSRALTNAATVAALCCDKANLAVALETRTVIGQATGILMARQGITAEEAFDVLRRASQRCHRKLRDVAAEVVGLRSGTLPADGGSG